jgi:hypothetical protein
MNANEVLQNAPPFVDKSFAHSRNESTKFVVIGHLVEIEVGR